jgi:hypothetical protein
MLRLDRVAYGEWIVATLWRQLGTENGRDYEKTRLANRGRC